MLAMTTYFPMRSPVGAAEGCDPLTLSFKSKIKRSQPAAAPTWVIGCAFCSLAKAGWQPTHLSTQSPVGAAEGCDLLICFGFGFGF
ncbi:hypothetical protein EJA70_14910 [Pseudomonas sp. PB103]|uniref:hypothetical protein n=1 Tax=Pseudomonas sp. PB103 TaxID=2494698 RepID=UPI00131A80BD|nr:hypothetical protein [Pseudomonas sp. PB103]KAE9644099.1 hypothetical protein EJA70_14910 [Pseudomonas sp. PB103]